MVAVLLIAALVAGGASVYRSFYSPSAFVLRYLSLLQEGRAADALALPGVAIGADELAASGLPATASDALLRQAALAPLADIEVVGEQVDGPDAVVSVRFTAGDRSGSTSFRVTSDGFIGVAPTWRFAQSPLAVLDLSVSGSMSFQVNGFTLDKRQVSADGADADPAASVPLTVFSPGLYSVSVDTAMAASAPVAVLADAPATDLALAVDAQPTADFVSVVQQRVDEFLTACASQEVLQPTGCPFGQVIDNRVRDLPQWSIVTQPQITLVPDGTGWRIPDAAAVAHIEVGVVSLYDGSYRDVSEDVPFVVNGTISVLSDGSVSILVGGTSDL